MIARRPLVLILLVISATGSAAVVSAENCNEDVLASKLTEIEEKFGNDPLARREIGEQATIDCPFSEAAHLLLGRAKEDLGEMDGAEQAYRQAAAVEPDSPEPWACLAHLARKQGNQDEHEIYLDVAKALADSDSELYEVARVADDEIRTPQPGGGYAFKEAGDIRGGLQIGSKSVRPKSITGESSDDYFAGRDGLGVNLGILFELGTATLKPEGAGQVDELGKALLRAKAGERYLVEGHSSTEGDPAFNKVLSERRAQAIIGILVREYGVNGFQLEYVGRGIEFPVLEGGVENKRKSRRVTVLRLYDE